MTTKEKVVLLPPPLNSKRRKHRYQTETQTADIHHYNTAISPARNGSVSVDWMLGFLEKYF